MASSILLIMIQKGRRLATSSSTHSPVVILRSIPAFSNTGCSSAVLTVGASVAVGASVIATTSVGNVSASPVGLDLPQAVILRHAHAMATIANLLNFIHLSPYIQMF